MSYTKLFLGKLLSRFALLFTSAILVLLLTACGSTPEKTAEVAETETTETLAEGEAAPTFSFDLTGPEENPYLQQEGNAPGPARALFNDAVNAMQSQQWSRAESLLQSLISQYPDLSGPYLNLGIVYRSQNQLEKAEEALAKAVSINGSNTYALNQLAFVKRQQGDFKAAELHYLSALAIWPKYASVHKNLGILYDLYMGDLAKALDHFQVYQYLQAEPDRQVNGWVIDLQRRINNLQAGTQP